MEPPLKLKVSNLSAKPTETLAASSSETQVLQKKVKRGFWSRKDGRRLKSLEPMAVVAPFIMPKRVGAQNMYRDSINVAAIERFVHKKRAEGFNGFGIMHVVISAYVRTISQYPGINRFLSGLRIYARNNIEIVMAVKKEMTLSAEETMLKFFFDARATVTDIYMQLTEKITEYQNPAQKTEKKESGFDGLARLLGYLPNFQLRAIVKFLDFLDYFGFLPEFLTRLSPFHCSMVITSMGSLGIQPIYHHLYDFGNVPVFMAFSAARKTNEIASDGTIHRVRHLDFTVTNDERICDGFYYASAFHEFRKNLKNPELLELPPENVVEDID